MLPADEETARDLLGRARDLRRAAHVPLADLAGYIGAPAHLISMWERHPPDVERLSRRDQLAAGRWLVLLAGLDRDQDAG